MTRILTAIVLVPLVVGVVLFGPGWSFLLLMAMVGAAAFLEFDAIVARHGIPASGFFGLTAGLLLLVAPEPLTPVVVALGMAMMAWSLRNARLETALGGAAAALLGVVYIFGAWRCATVLRDMDPHWLVLAMMLSWAGDTAALYVGKAMGKNKLAPRISPGKTWEGAVASLVVGTLVGTVYAYFLLPTARVTFVLLISAAGNAAGQLGDLCESALKRGAGLKDSGQSLPGHGGWLDRIDSMLFTIPVVYLLLRLTNAGWAF